MAVVFKEEIKSWMACVSDSNFTLEVPVQQMKNSLPLPSKLAGNNSWRNTYMDYLLSESLQDGVDQLCTSKVCEPMGKSHIYSESDAKEKQGNNWFCQVDVEPIPGLQPLPTFSSTQAIGQSFLEQYSPLDELRFSLLSSPTRDLSEFSLIPGKKQAQIDLRLSTLIDDNYSRNDSQGTLLSSLMILQGWF